MFEVQGVCKSYGGRQVLAPVCFCLPAGQCIGVAGSNGSGKSTLLQLLAQVLRPDSGDIRYDGRSILGDRKFLRGKVGYVPQENDLAADLTVRRQLLLWQSACGRGGDLPQDILRMLGLEELLPRRISTLSGGMQRRVSIAMALLTRPEVLIMDEATGGLDSSYCPVLFDWLEDHLRRGGCLIWCSHRQEELDRLCGNVLLLQDGKIIS